MSILQAAAGAIASGGVSSPNISAAITASSGAPSSLTGDGSSSSPWTASVINTGAPASITVTLTSDQDETWTDVYVSGDSGKMVLAIVDGTHMTCRMVAAGAGDLWQEQRKITFTSTLTGLTTDVWIGLEAERLI